MGIRFMYPYALLAFPLAAALLLGISLYANRKSRLRGRWLFTAFRLFVLLLVCLAMAGTAVLRYAKDTDTVLAVDLSDSMHNTEGNIVAFMQKALAARTDRDALGVVCFGEKAVVERLPSFQANVTGFDSYINGSFTNISEGLKLGQSILSETAKKRIVLVSDGLENVDDALVQAKILRQQGIRLDVLPVPNLVEKEVQVSGLKVPSFINKDAAYDIEVVVNSLRATGGTLLVTKNNHVVVSKAVTLRAGENRFTYSDVSDLGGGLIYKAEIQPDEDTMPQNNTMYAYGYVSDEPNVLLLEADNSARALQELLSKAHVQTTVLQAGAAPADIAALSAFDAVILANVSVDDLPDSFPALLASYVKDTGGGCIVTGGENAYALGGYAKTPLEELLPVEMDLKDTKDLPNLGMVIVLDRSGSMTDGRYGISKMELAKEAAIRSVDALNERDEFGVLAFDEGNTWAVPFALVGSNQETIQNKIAGIQPGGGTSILPALREAYNSLKDADTKLKHIILLTDGQAETSGYDGLIENMKTSGITLSTVAVGADADTKLLEGLSQKGNGRYYFTDEFTDLPKIFTKETNLAGKSYLNNHDFYPKEGDLSPILSGITSFAPLHGYVRTTAKDRADIPLISDEDEPVLATWQYGLGRTAAWTPDASGQWSSDWLNSAQGVQTLRNTVSWVLRRQNVTDAALAAVPEGGHSNLTVSIPYAEGVKGISGHILGPDGQNEDVLFSAQAPGEYTARIAGSQEGAYIANLKIEKINGDEQVTLGVSIPYSREYDIRAFDQGMALLNRLAQEGGGKIITGPQEVFAPIAADAYEETSLERGLLWAALVLFLADIALRRFPAAAARVSMAANSAGALLLRLPGYIKRKPKRAARAMITPEVAALPKEMSSEGVQPKAYKKDRPAAQTAEPPKQDTADLLMSKKKKRTGG